MNIIKSFFIGIGITLFLPCISLAQSGPGGVSDDSSNLKKCRAWFDAGDLSSQADGSDVTLWLDKSNSSIVDEAFWSSDYEEIFPAPLFRNTPSASINGKPVLSFEDGGMLLIGESTSDYSLDLATNPGQYTTYKRTIFIAFRTGNDVTERQYLWEQGGGWRGLNMYIYNNNVYMGIYDNNLDGSNETGSGTVPKFGYTYKTSPVQPNTTYVLSFVYNAPEDNSLDFTGNALVGTLNGVSFGSIQAAGNHAGGFGGLGLHDDPIGIGGVNSQTVNESGWYTPNCNGSTPCITISSPLGLTGLNLFRGRIAEICYYAYDLNKAERIIVQNYLAAKYFANVIQDDKYEYQSGYGNGVIGVGKESTTEFHNVSKGDNLFEIKVNMGLAFPDNSPQYLLVGHNNNPLLWTSQNTPDSATVQRLRRTWRFDRNENDPAADKRVELTFSQSDLPALPSGFTKYGLIIDEQNGPLPNFGSANTRVLELAYNSSTSTYSLNTPIQDGAYLSVSAIKPTIAFTQKTAITVEGDMPITNPASVEVKLNYKPFAATGPTIGYNFIDGLAVENTDYEYSQTSITLGGINQNGSIPFNIIFEDIEDIQPVIDFSIVLDQSTTSSWLSIGEQDTLTYKIYDDDPDPKATFSLALNDTTLEGGNPGENLAQVEVRITGTTEVPSTIRIYDYQLGTAEYGLDYTLPNTEWSTSGGDRYLDIEFIAGSNISNSFFFPLFDDNLDEFDETIQFTLEPQSGVGTDASSIINHDLKIIDNDAAPAVEFVTSASEGFEIISDPRVYVKLSSPSAKQIVIPFEITGGDATNGAIDSNSDYEASISGTVIIPAGDTLSYLYFDPETGNLNLTINGNDVPNEADETIIFTLLGSGTNVGLGTQINHTYTIKEYKDFEWQGAGGVGKLRDNTFWMILDQANEGSAGNIPNYSNRPIELTENGSSQPTVTSAVNGVNNHKVLRFDGSNDRLTVGSPESDGRSFLINTAGFYDSKSIFFAFKPASVASENTPQVIYEQGGTSRGLNIYLRNKRLYFQAWNTPDDDAGSLSPWGGNSSFALSSELSYDQWYVVSCHYDRNSTSGLKIYINGVEDGVYSGAIGRLYTHSARTAIGGMNQDSRFNDGESTLAAGRNFRGDIAEMVYFNEPQMNETRIQIIHNYLSAKFNIPLAPAVQYFDLAYANELAGLPHFNTNVAGVGKMADGNLHGAAQGRAELRISNPVFAGNNAFLTWGHNAEKLTDTWPYSSDYLPGDVVERSGRVWRFSETSGAGVNTADITINYNEAQNASHFYDNPNDLRLLVHYNSDYSDFSNATVYTNGVSLSGNSVRFSQIPINNGAYIALGNRSSIVPLPIELLNFDATFEVDHVNLFWATSTEINNDYFVVERAGENLIWKEVLRLNGAGNSTERTTYSGKDREPMAGLSYYRLKQVDYDGEYSYSDVVSVLNNSIQDNDAVFMYPNPSKNGTIFLRIPFVASSYSTNVRVIDLQGTVVWQGRFGNEENILEINYGNLNSGIYLVEILSEAIYETKKLVVSRK